MNWIIAILLVGLAGTLLNAFVSSPAPRFTRSGRSRRSRRRRRTASSIDDGSWFWLMRSDSGGSCDSGDSVDHGSDSDDCVSSNDD